MHKQALLALCLATGAAWAPPRRAVLRTVRARRVSSTPDDDAALAPDDDAPGDAAAPPPPTPGSDRYDVSKLVSSEGPGFNQFDPVS